MQRSMMCWVSMVSVGLVGGCGDSGPADPVVAPPPAVVVRTDPATPAECAHGGSIVRAGNDTNGDGVLNDDEARTRTALCNDAPVQPAPTIAVRLVAEPRGANCAEGGTAVQSGPDRNGNLRLDDDEVAHTDYVCGRAVITRIIAEPAGARCVAGGIVFQAGPDRDGDGMLDSSEVEQTELSCGDILARSIAIHTDADVAALAQIRSITGLVTVQSATLVQLTLPALEHVEQGLTIAQNPSLTRVSLPLLTSITGGLSITDNAVLTVIDAPALRQVDALSVFHDAALPDLQGFTALQQVNRSLTIGNNDHLTSAELPRLASVGGLYDVHGNHALANLSVRDNDAMDQLFVFDNGIQTLDIDLDAGVTSEVLISGNPTLTTANLRMELLDSLSVTANPALVSLGVDVPGTRGSVLIQSDQLHELLLIDFHHNGDPFPSAFAIAGSLTILAPITDPPRDTLFLPLQVAGDCVLDGTQLTEVTHLQRIGGKLQISNSPQLVGPVSLFSLGGGLSFTGNNAMTALAFSAVQGELKGPLILSGNAGLQRVSLGGITRVDGNVDVARNPALTTTPAELIDIEGTLSVHENAMLGDLGFPHLQRAAGGVSAFSNPALLTLELPALTEAPGIEVNTNATLHHLGLPALAASQLTVTNNVQLPACQVAAVFDRIAGQDTQSGNDTTTLCTP